MGRKGSRKSNHFSQAENFLALVLLIRCLQIRVGGTATPSLRLRVLYRER